MATLPALTKKLQPDTFHILHFIGHGGFDARAAEGALLFEDDAGRGRPISGEQLATILHDKASLRLVFLNSCEGARTSLKDPFSGVAASLIEREIPAVIAMQFEITDRAAIIFAGEFYAMLAEGQPVDASVTQARLLVFADDNDVEWGTPVLFLRVEDGVLFDVADASALPRVTVEDLPPKVSDPRTLAGGVTATATPVAAEGARSTDATDAAPAGPSDGQARLSRSSGPSSPGASGSDVTRAPGPADGSAVPDSADTKSDGLPSPVDGLPTTPPPPPTSSSGSGGSGSGGSGSGTGGAGSGSGGSGSGGSGSGAGGSGPVIPVGPTTIHAGPTARSIGIAAIALVAVVAVVLLLVGGRWPWSTTTGSAGQQAARRPPPRSSYRRRRPTPIPTGPVTTSQPSTPPPVTPPLTTPPPVKIAVEVVDQTGTNSRGIIEGVRLAVEDAGGQVNGVEVTVPDSLLFDDKGKASSGKDIVAKIIKDKDVVAVVGPYHSIVAAAQIPLSNAAGLLQCSPSANSETLTKPEAGAETLRSSRPDAINFIRTVTTNDIDPVGAAMFLLDGLGRQRAYIVDYIADDRTFRPSFAQTGSGSIGRAAARRSLGDSRSGPVSRTTRPS